MARSHGRLTESITDAVAGVAAGSNRVVALGGGADSAVLLHAAVQIDDAASTRAVFVDHGFDGSDELAQAARNLADLLGVALVILPARVDDGGNLEARARDARYEALDADIEASEIGLLGHTLDDQAETVIMRLSHGAGAGGLSGIPTQRGQWLRPLLAFSRRQTRSTAIDLDLPFADDQANDDPRFDRVRVRHDVVPSLESITPSVRSGIARSARLLREDDELLGSLSLEIPVSTQTGAVLIPASLLVTVPRSVAARACRSALRTLFGGLAGSARDVDQIFECAETGTTQQLSHNTTATHIGPYVAIGAPMPVPAPSTVAVGETFVWGDQRYRTSFTEHPGPFVRGGRFTLLDASVVGDMLSCRGVESGDRMEIEVGHTPVSELLRSSGVHASMRPVSLAVTVGGKIAAIAGTRTAAWATPQRGAQTIVIEREVHQ